MSASTIPLVLAALEAQISPLVENFLDGAPTTNEEMTGVYLCADENGDAPIEFTQSWAGSGSGARDEEYNIPCLLFSRIGDSDQDSRAAQRQNALDEFELIAGLFRPVSNLGVEGFTVRVLITAGALTVLGRKKGLLARIAFTVNVQARI